MSSTASSSNSSSPFSQTTKIRVVFPRQRNPSHYESAYVLVSSRLYWKAANEDGTNKPESILDFRNGDSLELVRLNDDEPWDRVDEIVKVDRYEGRSRITIRGRLHGDTRRKNPFLARDVEVEIVPNTTEEREVWDRQLRALIVPWNLLRQEMKNAPRETELETALGELADRTGGTMPSSMSTEEAEEKWRDILATLPEQMEMLSVVDKLTAQGGAAVGLAGTLQNLVANAERVTETAELLANLSRCITGFSTVFQLVSLSAKGVSMCVEAGRGQGVLPVALGQISILLRYVLASLAKIMKHSCIVNETAEDFVFDTLKETVCVLGLAETQLLRGRGGQIVNADVVKKVEEKVEQLRHMSVTAGNTSGIAENALRIANNTSRIEAMNERVNLLEDGGEIWNDGLHHVRPTVSEFFSGRKRELKTLEDILNKWSSAVITEYGGLGKTELMTAFADRAEQDGKVPGGVFWVRVDGGRRDVISLLAGLAEKLVRMRMSKEDRRNANLVIAALKQGLGGRQGRWLLCLDNADNSEVSAILNEVCGIAGQSRGNGWVIVTSRQGRRDIWRRMKPEQKLPLEPLCTEDAMVILWRLTQKIETAEADDEEVMQKIEELKEADEAEYCTLKKLCGGDDGHRLGGLPLAIVQAGSFIAQFEHSFSEYLNLFDSSSNEDGEQVMNNTEDLTPIRESQRSIWTTWKISVKKLSRKACNVFRAMAMLGPADIREAIVTGIVEVVDGGDSVRKTFRNLVLEELMHGSSLICRDRREGMYMYRMHRLVRRFILNDMVRGSAMWNDVYSLALIAVHKDLKAELRRDGNSFSDLPDILKNHHHEFEEHSLALVHHHMLPEPGNEMHHVPEVEDIHRFADVVTRFAGKWEEQVRVWEHWLDILQHEQAENRKKNYIQRLQDVWCRRNRRNDMKIRTASVYDSLGSAFLRTGKLNSATVKLEQSLRMKRAIYGYNVPHLDIAMSLNNLGLVLFQMGNLGKALEKGEECLEMRQTIHREDIPHLDIAFSLNNLGIVYHRMGKLDKAQENHDQSLKIAQTIHRHSPSHPNIAMPLGNLGLLYLESGKLQKAEETQEQVLKMRLEIHGQNRLHPDIATSQGNLGIVYLRMGEVEKALDLIKKSMNMRLEIYGHNKPHLDVVKCLGNLGAVYQEKGELGKAKEKHEQSLVMYRAIYGKGKPHPDIASALNNLGTVYYRMGNLEDALEKHKKCLDMRRVIHGKTAQHYHIAKSLCNLGIVYHQMNELDEALKKHEECLEMRQTVHGDAIPHLDTAESLNNVGLVHHEMGKLEEALENFEKCLEMRQAIHGDSAPHLDIADSLNNVGLVCHQMEKLEKALEKHEKCLEMRQAIYGDDTPHLDTAESLNNVGRVHHRMGKLDKALEKYEKCLEMRQTIFGNSEPHVLIANSLHNLGIAYHQMGKLDKALEKHEKCLEMRQAIHGDDTPHLDIADSLNNVGIVYHKMGKLSKALDKHEKCLRMRQAIYGNAEPHLLIANSLNNLGLVHHKMGRLDKALEKHEESLRMRRAIHGNAEPQLDIAESLNNVGQVYYRIGNLTKALEIHEQSLKIRQRVHREGTPHLDIALSLNNIGLVHEKMGKLGKARENHEKSLEMRRTILGPYKKHLDIAMSLNNLGNVNRVEGKLSEALKLYERSLEIYETVHGKGNPHPDTASTLNNVAFVCHRLGKLDEALKKHEECLKMRQAIHGEDTSHLDIASSLNSLGLVYEKKKNLVKALENHEKCLEMRKAIHRETEHHVDIAVTLNNLGNVYRQKREWANALEKHEESVKMYRVIHGRSKPHFDTAMSLWAVGLTQLKLWNLDQAAESMEECVGMLRIVFVRNSDHPLIKLAEKSLKEIHEEQEIREESSAIPEHNTETDEAIDAEESNLPVAS